MNIRSLTRAFNKRFRMAKTETAIMSAISNHKIRCGRAGKDRLITRSRLFTKEQVEYLVGNYTGRSVAEMSVLFNDRFGTNRTQQQIKTAVGNRGIKSGLTTQFKKGNVPWTAGKRGEWGANSGSFKKGDVPSNRKPIGTERVCSKDGFILIKVAERDPYTGFQTRYRHKHVCVWEEANGPVPKGMVVAFIDGDRTRCEPENLMLISRAELLNLNRLGYKDMPDKLKPSVLALTKLQVKAWAKEKKYEPI